MYVLDIVHVYIQMKFLLARGLQQKSLYCYNECNSNYNITIYILIITYFIFSSNASLCSVRESTYYSLCKHEGSLYDSAWANHMLILLHTIALKSKLAPTVHLNIVVLDCANYCRSTIKSSNTTVCLLSRYKLGQ
jgi:hypothetical protein